MERLVKYLGRVDYEPTWRAMQAFTDARTRDTQDEIWLLEHPPVYTLGLAGKEEHLLCATDIPVVKIDRGGQVTYHGPGQLVAYLLVDFKRMGIGVRELVTRIENAVIDLMAEFGVSANGDRDAPGVYVDGAKIAALGLRIKNGAVYHGLSLNVDMDLTPFNWINPCGYANLKVTQMKDVGAPVTVEEAARRLLPHLERHLTVMKSKETA
ncbi:lipoyl(octanoyl) transferase LipB [Crenobacter luteus]|uniref:Octanoyltransferase n=1 Tax=Crenobacter luteus TaxID=1452487 RepID=A0A161TLH4_9NEIS|nr:lipoyl(octanoyl) transferase LipB [Crenobacter luteus]KZE25289.1 octanoyltransferase [Crenobacter luteus]